MKKIRGKTKVKLVFLIVIILSLTFIVLIAKQVQDIRQRAATTTLDYTQYVIDTLSNFIKKKKKKAIDGSVADINVHYPLLQKGVDSEASGGIFHPDSTAVCDFKPTARHVDAECDPFLRLNRGHG